MNVKNNIYR